MSKWLSNFNNLLEKLDDTSEAFAEERRAIEEGTNPDSNDGGVDVDIDDILAKRGLALDPTDVEAPLQYEEDEEDLEANEFDDLILDDDTQTEETENVQANSESQTQAESVESTDQGQQSDTQQLAVPSLEAFGEVEIDQEMSQESSSKDEMTRTGKPEDEDLEPNAPATPEEAPAKKLVAPPSPRTAPPMASSARSANPQKDKQLVLEAKEAQKESRTLRRHLVSLNSQLEAAESELQAQRKELERAAEHMEKDRLRTKEAKENTKKLQNQELTALKAQNEQALKDQQGRFEDQLETYRKKLADVESQRKQEDGDWSNEMTNIVEREQEMSQRVMLLEDEKVTFLSQISTLQGQQGALGSRLESLTQAADNAMERERDAEDRLDGALTQHARQISHRQARESELERTIQELNTALVAKTSQNNRSLSNTKGDKKSDSSNENSSSARIETLQSDLETAVAHLALESEKSGALHQELREMSKETTQEASAIHAKQLQHDRKVAELELTISKLQREKYRNESSSESPTEAQLKANDQEMSNQVKVLSEELMRLREKMSYQNSETLALKNRLQTAINRATKAEEEVAMASNEGNDGIYDSMEKAKGPFGLGRRRKGVAPPSGSIRSAMRLNPGQGQRIEQIGKFIDVVDSSAVTTGKYLRRNPVARAGFIFYFLLMQLWTFVLLFFHAHSFESVHADFGAVAHGPHALMQQSSDLSKNAQVPP